MNYKIGDKVTLAPTTPLIITNILADSAKIEVKSPDNGICFWTSPDHLTPTNSAGCSNDPPQIGDFIVTKPTAKSEYGSPIGDRLGIIKEYSLGFKDRYIVRWVCHIYTCQAFHDDYSVVHPSQFMR